MAVFWLDTGDLPSHGTPEPSAYYMEMNTGAGTVTEPMASTAPGSAAISRLNTTRLMPFKYLSKGISIS